MESKLTALYSFDYIQLDALKISHWNVLSVLKSRGFWVGLGFGYPRAYATQE
jgi:hypothetical protein